MRTLKNCNRFGAEKNHFSIAMTQHYTYDALTLISAKAKDAILYMSKDAERIQLLNVLHKKLNYIQWPNVMHLKTIIADQLIQENRYCF